MSIDTLVFFGELKDRRSKDLVPTKIIYSNSKEVYLNPDANVYIKLK